MVRVALIGAGLEENLALLYLDSALTAAGHHTVRVAFDEADDAPWIAKRVAALEIDLVGLSMVFTARAREFAELAARLRAEGYRGHVTCGGHFATFNAQELLETVGAIDSVVVGEGEMTIVDLAGRLESPWSVAGVACRVPGGSVVVPQPRRGLACLDELLWPTREARRTECLGLPIANLVGSRGCYGRCSYCSIQAWHSLLGTGFRMRSIDDVAAEMAALYHDHGVRIFNFHDDNFFLPAEAASVERFETLADQLAACNVSGIGIAVKARPDSISRRALDALQRVGLFRLFLGVENASDRSLEVLARRSSGARNRSALDVIRANRLHVCFNILLFNPWSTLEEVAENLRFAAEYPEMPMNFCRTEVYAGTPIEARLRRELRLLGDWWGYDYTIEDRRVEALFDAFRKGLRHRAFAVEGLHHLAMRVDYHRQVLKHFFPVQTDRELERDARDVVIAINRDTTRHLGEALNWARRLPNRPTDDRVAEYSKRLAQRVDVSRCTLEERALDVLARLDDAANGASRDLRQGRGRARRVAAAAAAVILLETGATACGGRSENSPELEAAANQESQLPRILTTADVTDAATPEMTDQFVEHYYRGGLSGWMIVRARRHQDEKPTPQRPMIGVLVEPGGRVEGIRFVRPLVWPEDLQQQVRELFSAISFPSASQRVEFELQLDLPRPHQMFEMVARPLVRGDR